MSAGSIAGLFSWVFSYPIDFIKTKIQSQDLDNKTYKGIVDCLKTNIREHGKNILLRGLTTVCIRSIPVNSVGFLV
jgi:solute carrier family 25 carnitine/acylcarnitine transporter 20/29